MGSIKPVVRFKPQIEKALKEGDFGDDMGDGVHFKTLTPITTVPKRNEIERADPIPKIKPRTRAERDLIPRELALTAIKYYAENLNNPNILNPIRDGIPQCVRHPFNPAVGDIGCLEGCTTGVLPVAKNGTLGDVMTWLRGMIAHNFRRWEKQNPQFKGYVASL